MNCKTPELINYNESYQHSFNKYEELVYQAFRKSFDLIIDKFEYKGKNIVYRREPEVNGREQVFWHITTSESFGERHPDISRHERITWSQHVLLSCFSNDMDCNYAWKRNYTSKIHIWCYSLNYIVVVEERKNYLLFITAYPTNRAHTREKLYREYQNVNEKNLIYF